MTKCKDQLQVVPENFFVISQKELSKMLSPPPGYLLQPLNSQTNQRNVVVAKAERSVDGGLKAPDGFVLAKKVNVPTGDPMRTGIPPGFCIVKGSYPKPDCFIFANGGLQLINENGTLGQVVTVPDGYSLVSE